MSGFTCKRIIGLEIPEKLDEVSADPKPYLCVKAQEERVSRAHKAHIVT